MPLCSLLCWQVGRQRLGKRKRRTILLLPLLNRGGGGEAHADDDRKAAREEEEAAAEAAAPSARMPPGRHRSPRLLTKDDIDRALSMLDEGIGHSDLLAAVAPIRFITVGGMLAVSVFGNRAATKDIDFLLDPNVDAVQEYRDEVMRVIRDVAIAGNFNEDWMNDDFQIFVGRAKRPALFMQSVEQGVIAYQGKNLLVYAGRLDFALERKLRRISDPGDRARDLDLSDAITLVHWLKGDGGPPLSSQYVRDLDENGIGMPIRREGIERAAREYIKVYHTQGIVDTVWDEETQSYKYVNLENEWVFL